jgi:uncharacterized membrane protein HdeD (DUF308 family)
MIEQNGNENKWKNTLHKFLKGFSYVMVFFYLFLSFILIFSSFFSDTLNQTQRYSIGVLLFLYAIFRAYRIYQNQKEETNDEE